MPYPKLIGYDEFERLAWRCGFYKNIDTRSDFPRNYPLYAAGAASGKYY